MAGEDFLRPGDAPPRLEDEDRRDDVAEEEAKDALDPKRERQPGIQGPEHLGLTPPG